MPIFLTDTAPAASLSGARGGEDVQKIQPLTRSEDFANVLSLFNFFSHQKVTCADYLVLSGQAYGPGFGRTLNVL